MARASIEQLWGQIGSLLSCPRCAHGLALDPEGSGLRCESCGVPAAALRDGTLDFVSPDRDDRGELLGFGYQWAHLVSDDPSDSLIYGKRFEDLRLEIPELLGIDASALAGLSVLDAGCGHGQYARAFASYGCRTIGADLSEVVYRLSRANDTAWRESGLRYIRADALALPFPEASFDIVVSFGMVHHTPDPPRAAHAVARRVRPGGRLLLYVYERWAVGYVSLRQLFPLPRLAGPRLLHRICQVLALPASAYLLLRDRRRPSRRQYENTVLGLFDAYSPRYVFTYPPAAIEAWLRDAGMVEVERLSKCLYRARRRP